MAIKMYRAVYRKGDGDTYFNRSNINFHRWVIAEDMPAARVELTTIFEDGVEPIIIGWQEIVLESDEE